MMITYYLCDKYYMIFECIVLKKMKRMFYIFAISIQ